MSSGLVSYLVRRSLLMLLTLWLVSFLVFSLVRIVPGDTVTALIADAGMVPPDQIEAVRADLGLDKPFLEQYYVWASGLVQGDFGQSLVRHESTLIEIRESLPVTIQLALMSVALSLVIAIPLGVIAATRRNTVIDHFTRVFGSAGIAVPDFFIGTVVIICMARYLGYLPPVGFQSFWSDPLVNLEQLWIPASIIAIRLSAVTMRMTRSVTIEVLTQDYIRTAKAKGLHSRVVTVRHALRNALLPVLTIIGAQFGLLLGGALIMETLFALPGLGQSTLTAINRRDYSQLQTNALFIGAVVVLMNLIIDLAYSVLDPRVRLS